MRRKISKNKLRHVSAYLNALSVLPGIRFAGISGSSAMENCKKGADVDLCIVTASKLLFTGRFLSILLAKLYGVYNPRDGVCLNLFFDERDLAVPPAKRSLYTAPETAQLKPVFDRNGTHAAFLAANRWIREFLPNMPLPRSGPAPAPPGLTTLFLQPAEYLLKKIQLAIVKRNNTGHLISPTQLWLFRNDFQEKLETRRPDRYRSAAR